MANATETPNRWIPRPEIRKYVYAVLAAVGPIVVFYGLATTEEVALWLGVGATILGTPTGALAAANVPRD
ncbi:MAG: phage holin [Pseudoclavibacter sp.]